MKCPLVYPQPVTATHISIVDTHTLRFPIIHNSLSYEYYTCGKKMLRTLKLVSSTYSYYLNLGRLPSAKARTPSRKSSVAPKEFWIFTSNSAYSSKFVKKLAHIICFIARKE